jgi:hypothetical protein
MSIRRRSWLAKFRGTFNYTGMNPVSFLKRKFGLVILVGVVSYCLVYALAFIKLYGMEHPYKVASQWIFQNVPAGSRISSPHWDDKVPVGIPGKDTAIYQMNGREYDLPVYERDAGQMIDTIVKRVAVSDYLTFATPRAADSIPRIPDEYPNMTALLRLLWGEKVGFKLVHTTKNRPSFLGFTFNDDLADESFSVYDHPKVVVFKNEERLSADEILNRIKNVAAYEPLPSMNEMLLMDQGGWVPKKRLWNPTWNSYVKLVLFTVLLGVSVWILIGSIFRKIPDGGLGLSLLLGLVCSATTAWACGTLNLVPLTRNGGLFVALIFVIAAAVKVTLRASTRRRVSRCLSSHGLGALLAVSTGALVVLIMRSSDSSLLSGASEWIEQSYLTYLMRSQDSMPWDLVQAGKHLPAAFIDRFILAWDLRASGVPLELSLTAAFMVSGAVVGGALYSLLALITRGARSATIGVVIAIIPAVYLLHVARDLTNAPLVPILGQAADPANEELVTWVRDVVVGTPKLVEACDDGAGISVAGAIGLPKYAEIATPDGKIGGFTMLCRLDDAQQAYDQMMRKGLEFFVTHSENSATSDSSKARLASFSSRPELFARVFENQNIALFVPAFSRYYTGLAQ